MKYQVQIGCEFPCFAAEDRESEPLIINVNQTLNAPLPSPQAKEGANRWHYLLAWLVLSAFMGSGLVACAYGAATGDYSLLKSMAESSRDLLSSGAKLLKSP